MEANLKIKGEELVGAEWEFTRAELRAFVAHILAAESEYEINPDDIVAVFNYEADDNIIFKWCETGAKEKTYHLMSDDARLLPAVE
jgi:hypothetical protein